MLRKTQYPRPGERAKNWARPAPDDDDPPAPGAGSDVPIRTPGTLVAVDGDSGTEV